MSAVQQAAANTVLRIANLFEQNCALKHGLPKVGGPDRIDATAEEKTPPEPPTVNITNNIPAAPAGPDTPSPTGATVADAVKGSLLRRAAPWLIAAATGAGGFSLPVLWGVLNGKSEVPPVVEPTAPTVSDGSLLQYLQDIGKHLPEGWNDGK